MISAEIFKGPGERIWFQRPLRNQSRELVPIWFTGRKSSWMHRLGYWTSFPGTWALIGAMRTQRAALESIVQSGERPVAKQKRRDFGCKISTAGKETFEMYEFNPAFTCCERSLCGNKKGATMRPGAASSPLESLAELEVPGLSLYSGSERRKKR